MQRINIHSKIRDYSVKIDFNLLDLIENNLDKNELLSKSLGEVEGVELTIEGSVDDEGKPFTAHTTTPVFFICTDPYIRLKDTGSLGNIAPTILKYLEVDIPKEMEKQPLY